MVRYYLGLEYYDGPFELFSQSHLGALLVIFSIIIMIYLFKTQLRYGKTNLYWRYGLASLLIIQEILYNLWNYSVGKWSIAETLPLHLCGVAVICSAVMLVKKDYLLYELTYFWGLGGAVQALLTPDIGIYAFPHFRFIQFFVSHGLIVIAALYMTFVEGYRPTFKSLKKTFIITNIYMVFIAGFNFLTGGNYLFISAKPETASLLDFMGPWPWYILALEGLALVVFGLCYLPFAVKDLVAKRRQGLPMVS